MAGYFVADEAALAAVDTSSSPKLRWLENVKTAFYFEAGSTATADGSNIVAASDGGGRWFKDEYLLIDAEPSFPYLRPLRIGQICKYFQTDSDNLLYAGYYVALAITGNGSDWQGPL